MNTPYLGVILALLIATAAYAAGSLSRRGAVAAALVGAITFSFGGLSAALMLIVFFVSSSAWSRFGAARKHSLTAVFAKGGRRDQWQVFANGGTAAALALLLAGSANPLWLSALGGALAAATADTWATELGVLSRRRPRLISSLQPVAPGTSGGVSLLGLLASAGGAGLIGLIGWGLEGEPRFFAAALLGGFLGSLFDSLLGATIQAIYFCPICEKETEKHPLHSCGAASVPRRGWPWMNNDLVNFLATLLGAAIAALTWLWR